MKPGDHPEFFRAPAPEGRSRESTIKLDREGVFFHEGLKVEHPKMADAFHTWIRRHPVDGRFILSNGFDWSYFTVEDVPFFVRSIRIEPHAIVLVLSDGTDEPWTVHSAHIGNDGAIYTDVKSSAEGGAYAAKFTRHAQSALAPVLVSASENDANEQIGVRVGSAPENETVTLAELGAGMDSRSTS
jgi:hypothetical protein